MGRLTLLDAANFAGAAAAWATDFSGRESSLEATWELAEIEERWGDSLFFAGEADSAQHYRAAQRALIPPGATFSSFEENSRRMEAFGRLTNKLYAVGSDGKSRPGADTQPHPGYRPAAPQKSKAERWAAVIAAREKRTKEQTDFGKLNQANDHWRYHHLGELWLDAAKAMADAHPEEAHQACEWSDHYFGLYNQVWTAHLPASRWDSDGGAEMMDVRDLDQSLTGLRSDSPPPQWVLLLLDGNWLGALEATGGETFTEEFKPSAVLLADACRTAGREDAAQQISGLLIEPSLPS